MRVFVSTAKAGLFCACVLGGVALATGAGAAPKEAPKEASKEVSKEVSRLALPVDPKQLNIFVECDAYGAPNSSGDGMTKNANALAFFVPDPGYGNLKQDGIRFGEAGVAACDRALESPRLIPQHWLRRVSLLRARALHKIAARDIPGALTDLDLATAAAQDPSNIYYARSLGVGIDLIRAYALDRSGDHATARNLVMRAQAARPYDRGAASAALIVIGPDAAAEDRKSLLKAVGRLDPVAVGGLFDELFDARKFDEAIATYPLMSPGRTPVDLYITREERAIQGLRGEMEVERFAAWRGSQLAYALAATDQPVRARATIAAARERLERVTTSPPSPNDRAASYRPAAYKSLTQQAVPWIDYWADQVELRILVREKRFDEVELKFAKSPPGPGAEGLDLLEAIDAGLPAEERQAHVQLKAAREKMVSTIRAARVAPSLEDFYSLLPEAETRERIASFWSNTAKALKPSNDGFLDSDRLPGSLSAGFEGKEASLSMTQEAALLTAANLVRGGGGRYFRILRVQTISHSVTAVIYGQKQRPTETGYEARLLVLPVDAARAQGDWSVLDADEIHDQLTRLY